MAAFIPISHLNTWCDLILWKHFPLKLQSICKDIFFLSLSFPWNNTYNPVEVSTAIYQFYRINTFKNVLEICYQDIQSTQLLCWRTMYATSKECSHDLIWKWHVKGCKRILQCSRRSSDPHKLRQEDIPEICSLLEALVVSGLWSCKPERHCCVPSHPLSMCPGCSLCAITEPALLQQWELNPAQQLIPRRVICQHRLFWKEKQTAFGHKKRQWACH